MKAGGWSLFVLLALITLGIIWFIDTHERVPVTEQVRPGSAALVDDFLAARRVLERLEVKSRVLDGLEAADDLPANAMLVLSRNRTELSAAATTRLIARIEAGAHLLVEAKPAERRDGLLSRLAVTRTSTDSDEDDVDVRRPSSWRARLRNHDQDELLRIELPLVEAPLRARLLGTDSLSREPAPAFAFGREARTEILHFPLGQGHVTVVTDLRFLRNFNLARNDHAELLWQLVQLGGPPTVVAFLRDHSPGLGSWLLENALPFLVALGVLSVLWLWSLIPRFGAIQPDATVNRRRLLDHLSANGRLLWSLGARSDLASEARAAALERIERSCPQWRTMNATERVAFLERRCGLAPAASARLLETHAVSQVGEFVALMRACRQLHSALARGVKGETHEK